MKCFTVRRRPLTGIARRFRFRRGVVDRFAFLKGRFAAKNLNWRMTRNWPAVLHVRLPGSRR